MLQPSERRFLIYVTHFQSEFFLRNTLINENLPKSVRKSVFYYFFLFLPNMNPVVVKEHMNILSSLKFWIAMALIFEPLIKRRHDNNFEFLKCRHGIINMSQSRIAYYVIHARYVEFCLRNYWIARLILTLKATRINCIHLESIWNIIVQRIGPSKLYVAV